MANYQSPFALYTPGNPAQTFFAGFDKALTARKSVEETAKLIREREDYEQSQKLAQAEQEKNKEHQAKVIEGRDRLLDMLDQQGAGATIDPVQLNLAMKKFNDLSQASILLKKSSADVLLGSGYDAAHKWGQDMAQAAVQEGVQVAQFTQNTLDRIAEDKRASLARQLQRDITGDTLASQEGIAQAANESRERVAGMEQEGATNRMREQYRLDLQAKKEDPQFKGRTYQVMFDALANGVSEDFVNQALGEMGLPPLEPGQTSLLPPEFQKEIDQLTKEMEAETDPSRKARLQSEIDAQRKDYNDKRDIKLAANAERRKNPHWWKNEFQKLLSPEARAKLAKDFGTPSEPSAETKSPMVRSGTKGVNDPLKEYDIPESEEQRKRRVYEEYQARRKSEPGGLGAGEKGGSVDIGEDPLGFGKVYEIPESPEQKKKRLRDEAYGHPMDDSNKGRRRR